MVDSDDVDMLNVKMAVIKPNVVQLWWYRRNYTDGTPRKT